MLIGISARHGHLSAKTQRRIQEKISKLLKFHNRLTSLEVTVDLEDANRPEVEIRATIEKAGDLVATNSAPEVVSAVEGAERKTKQQIIKFKDKQIQHRSNPAKYGAVPESFAAEMN